MRAGKEPSANHLRHKLKRVNCDQAATVFTVIFDHIQFTRQPNITSRTRHPKQLFQAVSTPRVSSFDILLQQPVPKINFGRFSRSICSCDCLAYEATSWCVWKTQHNWTEFGFNKYKQRVFLYLYLLDQPGSKAKVAYFDDRVRM